MTRIPDHLVELHHEHDLPTTRSSARIVVCALILFISGVTPGIAQHRIFVTSTSGSSDLSTWDDAGGATGLAAGDAICRAHAADAGLEAANEYVAWLSDSIDDAYCRAHGQSGKVEDDCGEATLPTGAGPWLRMDGFPFGGPLERLVSPDIAALAPIRFDETGAETSARPFTGTDTAGSGSGNDCSGWTTPDSTFATIGATTSTGWTWSQGAATACTTARPLLCMRSGSGAALPAFEREGAKVFATVGSNNGDFSTWPGIQGEMGVAAADAVCRQQADVYDFENSTAFKAWISDSDVDANNRIQGDGPWVRTDGVPVAESKADLIDGTLFAPINLTPTGQYLSSSVAWTGTDATGNRAPDNCLGWTTDSSTESGLWGAPNFTDALWTQASSPRSCDRTGRLYCIEDATVTTSACRADADTLCLGASDRFQIEVDWESFDASGAGQAVEIGRQDSGLFTFFDPNNLELLVKVLDGCGLNGHYWVFYGATTDVGFELRVTDTETDAERTYENTLGVEALPVKDLEAFPCSP